MYNTHTFWHATIPCLTLWELGGQIEINLNRGGGKVTSVVHRIQNTPIHIAPHWGSSPKQPTAAQQLIYDWKGCWPSISRLRQTHDICGLYCRLSLTRESSLGACAGSLIQRHWVKRGREEAKAGKWVISIAHVVQEREWAEVTNERPCFQKGCVSPLGIHTHPFVLATKVKILEFWTLGKVGRQRKVLLFNVPIIIEMAWVIWCGRFVYKGYKV